MTGSLAGDPLSERLRRSRVRPVHDVQSVLSVDSSLGLLFLFRGLRDLGQADERGRRRNSNWGGRALAGKDVDIEALRLHGQLLLDLERVRGVVHRDVELLDDHRERDVGLLPGKGTALTIRARARQETTNVRWRRPHDAQCKPAFRTRRVATSFADREQGQRLIPRPPANASWAYRNLLKVLAVHPLRPVLIRLQTE